jgi:hypothetical protein
MAPVAPQQLGTAVAGPLTATSAPGYDPPSSGPGPGTDISRDLVKALNKGAKRKSD